jgi:hypothetical protein
MFKNIFENKIGEKLTNINNSGKQAFEWMNKFSQQLDITEKIQQQFNNSSLATNNSTTNNENNGLNVANISNASSSASVSTASNGITNGRQSSHSKEAVKNIGENQNVREAAKERQHNPSKTFSRKVRTFFRT